MMNYFSGHSRLEVQESGLLFGMYVVNCRGCGIVLIVYISRYCITLIIPLIS